MPEATGNRDSDQRLIEAGVILASELSLETVLRRIVELAVDLTHARYGALGGLTPDARLIDEAERAAAELRRLEVLDERERIGKELHDGVIQSLFAVGMNLQALASLSPDPETARRLEAAVEDVDHAIRDLRNYIFGLRPGILADRQLDQALRELGGAFSERTGVVTVVEVDADVASEVASRAPNIVQIVREALSNVGRHAAATTCRVRLARDRDGRVLLEVDDDGAGFDPRSPSTGMGLANLHERTGSLGGTIDIDSTVGQGTTLRIT